jgi:hypothetical protein
MESSQEAALRREAKFKNVWKTFDARLKEVN